jgi:hypothetical protein
VLFGGKGMPRGYVNALDDLATLSQRIPRLRELTDTELPGILGKLIGSRGAGTIGWGILHALTGGASVPVQISGWALAKFISRPMAAEATSRFARSLGSLADAATPRNVALLRLATQQLIDAGEGDHGSAQ